MTTFGGHTVPFVFGGGAAGPFINLGTLIAPNIINVPINEGWNYRQWGRLSDSIPLGLFNGYINLTNTGAAVFPWNKTLSDGIIHFDPRLSYDEDDYWYRVQQVDSLAPAPTQSFNVITPGVYTANQSWTVGITAPGVSGGYLTHRLDWSTDLGVSTFASIFLRFLIVP